MESLKEMTMKEVLRMGDWEDENVPLTLRRQLRHYESYISTWMSAFGFIEDDNHFLRPSLFDYTGTAVHGLSCYMVGTMDLGFF